MTQKKDLGLDCDFLFDARVQNLLFDFGAEGVLAYIQARATIIRNGGSIDRRIIKQIAHHCFIDTMALDVILDGYDLFDSDGEFYWIPGLKPFKDKISLIDNSISNISNVEDRETLEKMPYNEYLKTKYWREVSFLVKKKAGFKCAACGSAKRLETHHLNYDHKGDEKDHLEDLVCLCHACHEQIHRNNGNEGEDLDFEE